MSIIEFFILKKEFFIEVSYEDSLKKLKTKASGFTIEEMNYGNCKIVSDFSIGTATINKYKSIPISTELSLFSINSNSVKVSLKTEPRIEIFMALIIWVVLIFVQLISDENIPWWVTLILFPTILLFFNQVYRYQEKSLHQKVENHLKS